MLKLKAELLPVREGWGWVQDVVVLVCAMDAQGSPGAWHKKTAVPRTPAGCLSSRQWSPAAIRQGSRAGPPRLDRAGEHEGGAPSRPPLPIFCLSSAAEQTRVSEQSQVRGEWGRSENQSAVAQTGVCFLTGPASSICRQLPVQDSVEETPAVSTADRVWRALDGVEHLPRAPAAPQATPAAGGQRLVLPGAGSVPRAPASRPQPAMAPPAPGQARTLSSRSGPQGIPLPAPAHIRMPSARSGPQTAPQSAPRPASGHLAPHNRPRASPLVAGPKAQASKAAAQPVSARLPGAAPQAAKSAPAGRDDPASAPQHSGPPCAMCGVAPMRQPHQGACGHTACKSCWMAAVTRFKCPVCGKPARASQLLPRAV